jgi:hypothetical protein
MNERSRTFRLLWWIVDVRVKWGTRDGIGHFAIGATWARKVIQ